MQIVRAFVIVLLLAAPAVASAQTFAVHGSAGPTLQDRGYSLAAGVGFFPMSRLTLMVNAERTDLSSRVRTDARGVISRFRGGALTVAAAELRYTILGRDRVGPYALAGAAAGVSRPNVTPDFPDPIANEVRAMFFGGGIHVPLGDRVAIFGDARLMIGSEAGELLAVAPIRAGITVHF